VSELDAALSGLQGRLEIRKRFLGKEIDAAQAELRVLEAEAAQRQMALTPQVEMAKRAVNRVAAMVQKGLADNLELTKAKLTLLSLQQRMAELDLDMALIRKRLKGPQGEVTRYRPPETSRIDPVVYDASSDSSHRIGARDLVGLPPRFMGTAVLTRSTRPGSPPLA
jgi:hypothetical protein